MKKISGMLKKNNGIVFCIFTLLLIFSIVQPALASSSGNYGTTASHTNTAPAATTLPILSNHVVMNNTTNATVKNTCPCIVFRLDDVQQSYLSYVQVKIIDVFQKKNASLSMGVIGYGLHLDGKLVSYLKNSLKPGHAPIDVANHGWKHENFAALSLSQQVSLMNNTNQELSKTLGKKPNVFVAPYGMYNDDTLKAIKQLKMNVMSSSIWGEDKFVTTKGKLITNKDSLGLYHIPSMTEFQTDTGNETYWTNIPKDRIIDSINSHITKYGYDVFLLHPQNFATLVNGQYVNTVDQTHLDELASIIDYAKSKHIRITTISDIAGLDQTNTKPTTTLPKVSHVAKPVISSTSEPISAIPVSKPTQVNISKFLEATQPSKVVAYVETNGSLTLNVKYPSDDPVNARMLSMKIYRDFDTQPYMELKSVSENPYTVTLPMYHQYKIETSVSSMISGVNLVTLDTANQNVDVNIPWGGSMLVSVYYHDGQTPISDASISVRSQDNKTRVIGTTDSDGELPRFSLPSTNADGNYYVIDAKINNHLIFSSAPVTLPPGTTNKIKLIAPWPSMTQNLITVKVYNQTQLLSSSRQDYAVDMYDDKGNQLSESPVNIHGESHFWSMQIGDYVFKVVKTSDDEVLGDMSVTVDGSTNLFDMTIQNHLSTTKQVLNKIL